MIWKLKVALQNVLITLNNTDNMNKKLLKSREDFAEVKKNCENDAYYEIGFAAEKEEEPKEYPCVMIYRTFLYTLHYCFVYSSDIMA